MLRLLYLGDVVSSAGCEVVESVLPQLIKDRAVDGVIAQAENVSGGRGMTLVDMRRLQNAGIDAFTGGNWSLHKEELRPLLANARQPVCAPANWLAAARPGFKYVSLRGGARILIASLLGQVVSRKLEGITNPLERIEEILALREPGVAATVVNLHGDFSSEKRIFGYYLDGRASLVVGDHWHVPSADAMVLPAGTAHVTDVGMCGSLHSSLGVDLEVALRRWKTKEPLKNIWNEDRPWQFNAVLAEINPAGLAESIERIQLTV